MPRFEPFRALRYRPGLDLQEVTAPPYDVLSDADAAALRARDPHNIVHIDVPDPTAGEERYLRAEATLRTWLDEGVLVVDERPSFTLYRMRFTDGTGAQRNTVGVIGALEVVDEGAGGVLPHERTTAKASTDRLDLTRATSANLSPVWALSLSAGLSALLADPGEPQGTFAEHGVTHSFERVDEPQRVAAISAAAAANPALIADGHHRYGVARVYRDELRAAGRPSPGDADLTMTYLAELVDEQLSIDAIHRLYHGIDADTLAGRLAATFVVEPAGPLDATVTTTMIERGALCLVGPDGSGTWLRPRPEIVGGLRALDGAYLEHALGTDPPEVTYQHGVTEVLAALADRRCSAAVLIRPTSIAEIRRTAAERLLMPPKSTFFTPKLRTGVAVRQMAR